MVFGTAENGGNVDLLWFRTCGGTNCHQHNHQDSLHPSNGRSPNWWASTPPWGQQQHHTQYFGPIFNLKRRNIMHVHTTGYEKWLLGKSLDSYIKYSWDHEPRWCSEQTIVKQGFPQSGETLVILCNKSRMRRTCLKILPVDTFSCHVLYNMTVWEKVFLKRCVLICYLLSVCSVDGYARGVMERRSIYIRYTQLMIGEWLVHLWVTHVGKNVPSIWSSASVKAALYPEHDPWSNLDVEGGRGDHE
jgi:hypothetical protein